MTHVDPGAREEQEKTTPEPILEEFQNAFGLMDAEQHEWLRERIASLRAAFGNRNEYIVAQTQVIAERWNPKEFYELVRDVAIHPRGRRSEQYHEGFEAAITAVLGSYAVALQSKSEGR